MTSDHHAINPHLCPLCGKPNDCAMAECNAAPDAPCWCKSEAFPPELLNRVSETATNRACICRTCLKTSKG